MSLADFADSRLFEPLQISTGCGNQPKTASPWER
jgi:hypothetical protein